MDATERARLRALCEAATPGPWRVEGCDVLASSDGARITECVATVYWPMDEDGDPYASDAAIIVGAVNALPALLDALDVADARIAKAERERDEARAEVRRLRAEVNEALLIAHTAPPPVHAAHWCLRLVETLHNALKTDGAP